MLVENPLEELVQNKKILVTGGSGYLGTHVRKYFQADDLSRRSGCDLNNNQDLSLIKHYDVIVHMAACVDKRPEADSRNFDVNVTGTIKLLENLSEGQVFIYCSTKDVYGSHIDSYEKVPETCSTEYLGQNAYEWSKLIAEKYVEYYSNKAKARAGIFRLSTVYAPATEGNAGGFVSFFAKAIKTGQALQLKMRGEQIRDLLHVEDLAQAFELFINSDIKQACYNIGGGMTNSITLYQLTQLLGQLTGYSPKIELSDDPVKEQIHYVTDISKLARELNWQPKLNLETGLKTLF
jgi:nucleoside-diphosphate-sugar epimerase